MSARPDWHEYGMGFARHAATRATCNRRKVGAAIVKDGRCLVTGYNGSKPGEPHCIDVGCLMEAGHCVRTTHAEANAVAWAAREGVAIKGATLYCTLEPCRTCRGLLASAGVTDIRWEEDYGTNDAQ